MSYDLHIIAKRQPRTADVAAFIHGNGRALQADGTLRRGAGIVIHDQMGTWVEIDGPNRLEPEDIPEAAIGAIGRSGWLVEVSVKPSTDASWPGDLAIDLARAADGVVYDPQQDAVTWPVDWRSPDSKTGDVPIDQIAATWCFPRDLASRELPRRLLDAIERICPEALPKRYGEYEPLQRRFEGNGASDDFLAFWAAQATGSLPFFFWTASRPCFGGDVNISPLRTHPPNDPRAWVRLSMEFDGRAFARDPAFIERFVRMFTEVASLGSPWAGAWVERGHTYRRGRTWGTAYAETGPMPRAYGWVGVPPSPTWLTWFGGAYVAAVRSTVASHIAIESDAGIMLRLGTEPMNADQLADEYPPLPGRLLARRNDQPGAWLPGVWYSLVSGTPSDPAEEILPFGDPIGKRA